MRDFEELKAKEKDEKKKKEADDKTKAEEMRRAAMEEWPVCLNVVMHLMYSDFKFIVFKRISLYRTEA